MIGAWVRSAWPTVDGRGVSGLALRPLALRKGDFQNLQYPEIHKIYEAREYIDFEGYILLNKVMGMQEKCRCNRILYFKIVFLLFCGLVLIV